MAIEMQICHAGLLDIAMPIVYNDCIIAYLIMGQLKTTCDFTEYETHIQNLGLDVFEHKEMFDGISCYSDEKLHSVANIAFMLTQYILLENMMSPNVSHTLGKAEQFIDANLQNELTVLEIEKGTNISKTVLYRNFHTIRLLRNSFKHSLFNPPSCIC